MPSPGKNPADVHGKNRMEEDNCSCICNTFALVIPSFREKLPIYYCNLTRNKLPKLHLEGKTNGSLPHAGSLFKIFYHSIIFTIPGTLRLDGVGIQRCGRGTLLSVRRSHGRGGVRLAVRL